MVARIVQDANSLRISKPGIDVLTGVTGQQDLIFSNDYRGFTVYQTGTMSVPAKTGDFTPGTTTVSYPTLGYLPLFVCCALTPDGVYSFDYFTGLAPRPGEVLTYGFHAGCSATQVRVYNYFDEAITARYILFYSPF